MLVLKRRIGLGERDQIGVRASDVRVGENHQVEQATRQFAEKHNHEPEESAPAQTRAKSMKLRQPRLSAPVWLEEMALAARASRRYLSEVKAKSQLPTSHRSLTPATSRLSMLG